MRRTVTISVVVLAIAVPMATVSASSLCFGREATILGTPGNDEIEGTPGPDVIVTGRGRDLVFGYGGDDRICLGRGRRGGRYMEGDAVDGGAGDDRIRGGRGPDHFYTSHTSGDDHLLGGPGHDSISDWYGRDILVGGRGNDHFFAGPRSDRVFGGPGDDVIEGDPGYDTLRGGSARDTLSYQMNSDRQVSHSSSIAMVVNLTEGVAFSRKQPRDAFDPDKDRIAGFENVETGGGADVIRGNANDNVIVGDFGANRLYGGAGDDTVRFSRGRAWGGPGNDRLSTRMKFLSGGSGFDVVIAWLGRFEVFPVHLDLERGYLRAAGTLGKVKSVEGGWGSTRNDVLLGDDSHNEFFGGPRHDRLDGRGGRDLLKGGNGEDTCRRGEVFYACE